MAAEWTAIGGALEFSRVSCVHKRGKLQGAKTLQYSQALCQEALRSLGSMIFEKIVTLGEPQDVLYNINFANLRF